MVANRMRSQNLVFSTLRQGKTQGIAQVGVGCPRAFVQFCVGRSHELQRPHTSVLGHSRE
eukprot:909650-Pelagomonas_calceolata.AAC.1